MRQEIKHSSQVWRDLEEIVDYLRAQSLETAQRFSRSTEVTFKFLAANREIGQLCQFANPRLTGMRIWRVEGFPNHLIYYRPIPEGVEILRVLHGARNADAIFGS